MKFQRALAVGILIIGAIAAVSWRSFYLVPGRQAEQRQTDLNERLASFTSQTPPPATINRTRRSVQSRLLRAEVDEVDHLLRTSLMALAEARGLQDITITVGSPKPVLNPAIASQRMPGALSKPLRAAPDFFTISSSIRAVGTSEAAAQLMLIARTHPLIHRIDQVTLQPADRENRSLDVTLGIRTAFAPNLATISEIDELAVPSAEPSELADRLATGRFFFLPEPIEVAEAPKDPPRKAPQPAQPDLGRFYIAGIIVEPVVEVWIRDSQAERTTRAGVGEVFGPITVESATSESVRVLYEDSPYLIPLGGTLLDRQPVTDEEQQS